MAYVIGNKDKLTGINEGSFSKLGSRIGFMPGKESGTVKRLTVIKTAHIYKRGFITIFIQYIPPFPNIVMSCKDKEIAGWFKDSG